MSVDLATLAIKIDSAQARIAALELDKLGASGKRAERSADSLRGKWKNLTGAATGLVAAVGSIAAALAIREIIQASDAYTLLNGRLTLVTNSSQELTTVQKSLYEIAQRSRSEYLATADVFTRFAQATKGTGVAQKELLTMTETLNKAFVISGATTSESSNAMIQLSQAFASGVLRGDEFNTIMESGGRIVTMLTDYLHVNRGELRAMAQDGKITAEILRGAIAAGAAKVNEEFNKMPVTVGQAWTEIKNTFDSLIVGANGSTGATADISQAILDLKDTIESNKGAILELFKAMISLIGDVIAGIVKIGQALVALNNPDNWEWLHRWQDSFDSFFGQTRTQFDSTQKSIEATKQRIQEIRQELEHPINEGGFIGWMKRMSGASPEKLSELRLELSNLEKQLMDLNKQADNENIIQKRIENYKKDSAALKSAAEHNIAAYKKESVQVKKNSKDACEAHKKQLTCAEKALQKEVAAAVFAGKKMKDSWQIQAEDKYEVQSRSLQAAIDLQEQEVEQTTELQQNMVNDLGRIFDSYISDILHGQIDSVGDLFKGLFDSILDMFMRMVAQFAANSLVDLIFGNGASGGTTLGSALSSLFGGSGSGGGLGLAYNGASVANTVSGWLGGPSTSSITAPISQYVSGQLGLGSGTLGTNLMTGAHALYGAATTGVGSISSWYAGLQAAANGVNAGTSLALIEGSYGPAAEVVGTQIGATAGEEMAATLANTTVDFSIDAAGGYAASTGGSAASTGAGAGSAGWASAGWVALPLVGGSIWMGLENATDDKPAEQARKNWGLDTGISRDNLLAEEAIGTLSKKWTEQFEHVFDFATQGFGNLADMSHQLGAAMDVQHVQQYVSTLAGVNVSMEQSTQVMDLAHEAAQGNEAAFNQLYETLNGMMQATGDSTEYASASAYGLVQAMIDAGQATDATIAELNGITQEMIDQQAAADALAETMVVTGIATEDTAEQIAEAYGAGSEAIEHYIAQMSGLDEEWLSSADIMNDVRAAASGGAGALQTLINDLEGTGLSSTQAAQAAQAMTDAVRRFSATNLDLEATARLNVEVQGAANITSSIYGSAGVSYDPYDPYGDAEGSAVGGIMVRPTFFAPGRYGGEAGAEGILPLPYGPGMMKDIYDATVKDKNSNSRPIQVHNHFYVDGKEIATTIMPAVDRHMATKEMRGISGRTTYAPH